MLIKNENSNICGTGGKRVKTIASGCICAVKTSPRVRGLWDEKGQVYAPTNVIQQPNVGPMLVHRL